MNLLAAGALVATSLLAIPPLAPSPAVPLDVIPPTAHPHGQSYSQWSADWWQWFMEHPVAGHPGVDDPQFDVASGQSGRVWFLATPLDFGAAVPRTRIVTVPKGVGLFLGLLNAEMSSLEGVPDEGTQRSIANWLADHTVDLACSIDGKEVDGLDEYRCASAQFEFTPPDPWIFGSNPAGETGTAVADGYYLFLQPMSAGLHVIHYSGRLYFEAGELGPEPVEFGADMTYVVDVQ